MKQGKLLINRARGLVAEAAWAPGKVVHWSSSRVVGCVGAERCSACSPTKQNVQIPMFLVAQLQEPRKLGRIHRLLMDGCALIIWGHGWFWPLYYFSSQCSLFLFPHRVTYSWATMANNSVTGCITFSNYLIYSNRSFRSS
jgi:hypothetical protein